MTSLLSIDRVTLAAQPGMPALITDLSLNLERGQTLAICAPSGAGKTSLLRAIIGELPPSSGSIRLHGQVVQTMTRQERAKIAYVSQSHDLVEPLRVNRNVMAGALGRWSTWRALRFLVWPNHAELAEAETMLASVGLSGMGGRGTSSLSGGERQRVAIARALVQAPDLLLADEPVASLDPETANEILRLLTRLARDHGMGLICSLHQPELAKRYFDRVISLQGGAIGAAH